MQQITALCDFRTPGHHGCTRSDTELGKYPAQMSAHCPRAYVQNRCDDLVGVSLCNHTNYFLFPRTQLQLRLGGNGCTDEKIAPPLKFEIKENLFRVNLCPAISKFGLTCSELLNESTEQLL